MPWYFHVIGFILLWATLALAGAAVLCFGAKFGWRGVAFLAVVVVLDVLTFKAFKLYKRFFKA